MLMLVVMQLHAMHCCCCSDVQLGALMIKFHQGFSATGIYEEGYNVELVNILLIASCAGVFFAGLYSSVACIIDTLSESRVKGQPDATANTIPTGLELRDKSTGGASTETKPNTIRENPQDEVQECVHPLTEEAREEEAKNEPEQSQRQQKLQLQTLRFVV
jgi:hypothetical protein